MSGLEITEEHVQALAAAHGEAVLVKEPGVDRLWVIGTGNRHYLGADSVVATSEQVVEMADESEWVSETELSFEAAQRLSHELTERESLGAAFRSAMGMRNPAGHPDAPTRAGEETLPGAEWREQQKKRKKGGGDDRP